MKWLLHLMAYIWGEVSKKAIKVPFTLAIMYNNITGATPWGGATYTRVCLEELKAMTANWSILQGYNL